MPRNRPEDIQPTGGAPTGAPDYPPPATPTRSDGRFIASLPKADFTAILPAAIFIAALPAADFIASLPDDQFLAALPTTDWSGDSMWSLPNTLPGLASDVEQRVVTFDFSHQLGTGVTLDSSTPPVFNISVHAGADDDPTARKIGDYVFIPGKTGASPGAVLQMFGNGVGGATLLIQCVARNTNGEIISIEKYLPFYQPS